MKFFSSSKSKKILYWSSLELVKFFHCPRLECCGLKLMEIRRSRMQRNNSGWYINPVNELLCCLGISFYLYSMKMYLWHKKCMKLTLLERAKHFSNISQLLLAVIGRRGGSELLLHKAYRYCLISWETWLLQLCCQSYQFFLLAGKQSWLFSSWKFDKITSVNT